MRLQVATDILFHRTHERVIAYQEDSRCVRLRRTFVQLTSGARSDEYADCVREWTNDDHENIERIEGWLAEWKEKLDHLE